MASLSWYYVMGAELKEDYVLSSSELPPTSNTFPNSSFSTMAFQHDVLTGKASTVVEFTENTTITVKLCGKTDFQHYVMAPRFLNGMYLFGELNKLVPVSKERFINFDQTMDEAHFLLAGVPTETVSVTVYDGTALNTVSCTIREDYFADLTITKEKTMCA